MGEDFSTRASPRPAPEEGLSYGVGSAYRGSPTIRRFTATAITRRKVDKPRQHQERSTNLKGGSSGGVAAPARYCVKPVSRAQDTSWRAV